MIVILIAAALALGILAAIVRILWTHPHLPLLERLGLGMTGAGLLWGGVDRWQIHPLGPGDVLFLFGVAVMFWRWALLNPVIKEVMK